MGEAYGTINGDLVIVLSVVLGERKETETIHFHDWSMHMQAFLLSLKPKWKSER
jgi:hypothetical protein